MLLTSLNQVRPGMRVGAQVMHPAAPDVCLLKPGAEINESMLARLQEMGVARLWIEHHLTGDLDAAIDEGASRVKREVYDNLKKDIAALSTRAMSKAQVQSYRRAMVELVRELIAHRAFAGLTDQLYDADCELVSHCSNVAYLAVVIGLEIESYLVKERPKVPEHRARNLVNLGLGGMLHDVGKIRAGEFATTHEVIEPDRAGEESPYRAHPEVGYQMMRDADVPPTVRHVVLSHHRRFDGTGWPQIGRMTTGAVRAQPAGSRLHIFTRIVSAANALDNLMREADGRERPPVAALHDFASDRFEGWFDPVVREAVLRHIPPFVVGMEVGLSDGRPAVVVAPNLAEPCRPAVRVLDERAAASGIDQATVDLAVEPALSIRTCAGADVSRWLYTLRPAAGGGRSAA